MWRTSCRRLLGRMEGLQDVVDLEGMVIGAILLGRPLDPLDFVPEEPITEHDPREVVFPRAIVVEHPQRLRGGEVVLCLGPQETPADREGLFGIICRVEARSPLGGHVTEGPKIRCVADLGPHFCLMGGVTDGLGEGLFCHAPF